MLELFYKHLINELLMTYFEQHPIQPGSRFYMIVENDRYRMGLLESMKRSVYAHPISIDNIFGGNRFDIAEEQYKTFCLTPQESSISLIVGDSSTATDDYLTTLRNAVCSSRTDYGNDYGVLYILSSNRLESLTTASVNLQNPGMPFNTFYIKDGIEDKIERCLMNENEKMYLRNYLSKISARISDGGYTIFDFKEVLSVLQQGTMKENFVKLGYFKDDEIYSPGFKATEKGLTERIESNTSLFNQIYEVISCNDKQEWRELLEKIVDDKLASSLKDINEVDFTDILTSIERKKAKAKLTFEEASLTEKNDEIRILIRSKGNTAKKSQNFILLCDPTDARTTKIRLGFNADIKGLIKGFDSPKTNGRFLYAEVGDETLSFQVGRDNNMHKFFVKRIPASAHTFDKINPYFSLKKTGQIVVNVPEDINKLELGNGETHVQPAEIGVLEWQEDYVLDVLLANANDKDEINFSLKFKDVTTDFIFKLNTTHIQSVSLLSLFESIWTKKKTFQESNTDGFGESSFSKVCGGDEEYSVEKVYREYPSIERQMIKEDCLAMKWDSLNNSYTSISIDVAESVRSALTRVFEYFKRYNTVPSLCYIDDELEYLYKQYLNAVIAQVDSIPESRTLTRQELELTKLGVVEKDEKVMFSPFHPLLVAFMLEFKKKFDSEDFFSHLLKLISPFYLIPYLYYSDKVMRPYCDKTTENIRTWLFYEPANNDLPVSTYNITTKMVQNRLREFCTSFSYLFQDKDCPIVISTIGIKNDENVIKGILEFIKEEYAKGKVQRIELHEYVDNILHESFFERLNRLYSDDLIVKELDRIECKIDSNNYNAHEIIRQLFSRVTFYKHELSASNQAIGYCHIAFYQMNVETQYITPPSGDMRVELSMGGLISIPSTLNKNNDYNIGFGSHGIDDNKINSETLYPAVMALNMLYANARNGGRNQFQKSICVAKSFTYNSSALLDSIYENANWVTFLNPEVDINFFYKQDLYIVHYTDQYTINAKYDSITVTKHISQYENLLRQAYARYRSGSSSELFDKNMRDYFNSLNGSWLLGIINKSEYQIKEKLSLVATSIVMKHFLKRSPEVIWIPISLEEILRVSSSVGLPKDFIFTAKDMGASGSMSDDLLMMGLDVSDPQLPKLRIYPIEVKLAKQGTQVLKGELQVTKTYRVLKERLMGEECFTKNVLKTFFASQYLTNVDKFWANNLLTEKEFETVMNCRFDLLNVRYEITDDVKDEQIGHAALVYYSTTEPYRIETKYVDDVPVCHIYLTQSDCFHCVAQADESLAVKLEKDAILLPKQDCVRYDISSSQSLAMEADSGGSYCAEEKTSEDRINVGQATPRVLQQSLFDETEDVDDLQQYPIRIEVGKSMATQVKVFFEPNNTRLVSHPNMAIIGTMGTGKTQFARSVIAQLAKEGNHNVGGRPIGVLVFDYKGDYRDKLFLKTVGGDKAYRFNYPFNPLKLIITNDIDGMNLPAITANRISDSFGKAYNLGIKQQNAIKELIISTYTDFGITKDPATWTNVMPTMDNVIEKFFEEYDASDSVYALFSTLRDYTIFTSDASQCVSLFEWLDCVRVIDLTLYPDDTKKLIVSLILDLFYAEMQQLGGSCQQNGFRELRAMIMVDEAHQFLRRDFTALRKIISEGRMFGVGMILSTQNIGDFKTSKEDYTQFILSWIIHHVNSISRQEIASIFGVNDQNIDRYIDFVNKAKIFESVCKIGSRVEGIRDLPFFELIEEDSRFTSALSTDSIE